MIQIKNLVLTYFRNDEHSQYMLEIDGLVQKYTPEILGIADQYLPFKTALNKEGIALKVEQGSSNTLLIVNADDKRDRTHRGFELQVESYSYHWNTEMVEAARRIGRIVSQYGNLRMLAYNEESSAIGNLVQELRAEPYSTDLETLALTTWVDQLATDNENFKSVFNDRANEAAARASGNVRAARAEVDPAYNEMVKRVNALVVVNGEEAYAEFIDKVNYYIDYYKTTIAARKGRNGKENGEGDKPTA
jgi:ribosomal protein L30/L7E